MAAKKPDAAPARATVRLKVRTVAAHGNAPRYRAGLGPFWRDPVVVEVEPWQAAALHRDSMLAVSEAE